MSIYEEIVALLKRTEKRVTEGCRVELKLLLCSPALDYPKRIEDLRKVGNGDYKDWGTDFLESLTTLTLTKKVSVDIAFLPDRSGVGCNPLDEFIQVLASYCESKSDENFEAIYRDLTESAKNKADKILSLSKTLNRILTIRRPLTALPFQIVLAKSASPSMVT